MHLAAVLSKPRLRSLARRKKSGRQSQRVRESHPGSFRLEAREDGTVVSHFGPGMDVVATQTAWDPPRRFAAEAELAPNGPKMATEWIVEARAGGTCIVRVVHSLFASSDDWDDLLESVEAGWPDYFRILTLYLKYFRGQQCSNIQLMSAAPEPASQAWDALTASLGLKDAVVGERRITPAGAPPLAG